MNKIAIAALTIAAAFGAQAQSANDAYDQAGYGAMAVAQLATAVTAANKSAAKPGFTAGLTTRSTVDSVDQAGYGAMTATGASLRTRADVRAEAIAARDADVDAAWREGGDPQYAVLKRVRHFDTAHMVAGTPAKSGE